jgi:glycosyltransferase involved in cell wall biosynthesis
LVNTVAFLVQRFPGYGGAEGYVYQLVLRLADNGIQCTIFTSDIDKRNAVGLSESVKIVKLPVLFKIGEYAIWLGLLRKLLASNSDIYHVNTYGYYHTDAMSFVKRLKNSKTILTAHGFHGLDLFFNPTKQQNKEKSFLLDCKRLVRPFYDFTLGFNEISSANALVALSQKDIAVFKWMGAQENKIHEIPLGVRDVFFEQVDDGVKANMRKRLDGYPIILSVGELSWVKGKDVPLRALTSLVKEYPRAKLVYVGKDGGFYVYLKELAGHLGLEKNVLFEGYVAPDQLVNYFAVADVLVHTSYAEGLSTIILEAMAAGVPVVSTPAGGNAQLLQKSNAGIVVPFDDPNSVCLAVNEILGDKPLQELLSANGRNYAVNNLRWAEIAQKYLSLYQYVFEEN